jgi:hypothetical protein
LMQSCGCAMISTGCFNESVPNDKFALQSSSAQGVGTLVNARSRTSVFAPCSYPSFGSAGKATPCKISGLGLPTTTIYVGLSSLPNSFISAMMSRLGVLIKLGRTSMSSDPFERGMPSPSQPTHLPICFPVSNASMI